MNYIAHRGLVDKNAKENTYNAFLNAIKSPKYKGFELDLRVSKDGEYFVYHNYLLDGKPFKNYLKKDLIKKGILKLSKVLELETDKIILIELKDFNLDIKKLSNFLNKYSKRNIYLMSFDNNIIKKIKKINSTCKFGILDYVINSDNLFSYDFICMLNGLISEKAKNYYKMKNIKLFSYGILSNKKIYDEDIFYIIDDKLLNSST